MFWSSAIVRRNLLAIDSISGVLLFFMNAALYVAFSRLDDEDLRRTTVSHQIPLAITCVSLSLTWGATIRVAPAWYYSRRNAFLIAMRVLCTVVFTLYAHFFTHLDARHVLEHGAGVALPNTTCASSSQLDANSALAVYFLCKGLLVRCFISTAWIVMFLFPVPFKLNLIYCAANLPNTLIACCTTALLISRPPFDGAVCRMYRGLRPLIFHPASFAHGDSCPSLAPSLVAYFSGLWLGIYVPMAILWEIEALYRRAIATLFRFEAPQSDVSALQPMPWLRRAARFVGHLLAAACMLLNVLHYMLSAYDSLASGPLAYPPMQC